MLDLENITLEELKKEYSKTVEIKKQAFAERDLANKNLTVQIGSFNELNTKYNGLNTEVQITKKEQQKQTLSKEIKQFGVKDKFIDDFISKADYSADDDETKRKIKSDKVLEKYPEFKDISKNNPNHNYKPNFEKDENTTSKMEENYAKIISR